MGKRRASVDAMVQGFDEAISNWVDKNLDSLVEEYGLDKVESLADDLGDRLYAKIQLDPSHLKRFIGFYVNDPKMQDLVDDVMADSVRGASLTPAQASALLRETADFIASSDSPSLAIVVRRLGPLLESAK